MIGVAFRLKADIGNRAARKPVTFTLGAVGANRRKCGISTLSPGSRSAPHLFRPVRYKPDCRALLSKNCLPSVSRFAARTGRRSVPAEES